MTVDAHRGHEPALTYHASLVGDPWRVTAYERAIRTLVRPGDVVLDAGAGTGLLALMAARRGAARVHAVESTAVAEAIVALARANGVEERIIVHRADLVTLPPAEPVDLVVSDFMGRFVYDDDMADAIEATARWLRPGGRFCPAEVQLRLAPVGIDHLLPTDVWRQPLGGLDLGALEAVAMRRCYGAHLPATAVLGDDAPLATLRPPNVAGLPSAHVDLTIRRAGRLRALAGWFVAELAPGVILTTAPGVETHWGQHLFPLPACPVRPGDRIRARVWLTAHRLPEGAGTPWRWEGVIERAGAPDLPFALGVESGWAPPGETRQGPALPGALDAANARGVAAWQRGDLEAAREAFSAAARALGPGDDEDAAAIWENVGVAWLTTGQPRDAVPALLRALDGDPASREQSARLLVDALFRCGRTLDGQRLLTAYEAAFGPHPSGWAESGGGPPHQGSAQQRKPVE